MSVSIGLAIILIFALKLNYSKTVSAKFWKYIEINKFIFWMEALRTLSANNPSNFRKGKFGWAQSDIFLSISPTIFDIIKIGWIVLGKEAFSKLFRTHPMFKHEEMDGDYL